MIRFYRILGYIISPLLPLLLKYRQWIGKEDTKRLQERFGKASMARPKGLLIWVHAASIGESNSVLPFIDHLLEQSDDVHVLITTVTVTSAKQLTSKLPDRAHHQYVPIDLPIPVKKFLNHWKPDLAFWTESEFWPNLVIDTKKSGCESFVINGRISERSYRTWLNHPTMIRQILHCFSAVFPQSEEDVSRFKHLGAANVVYHGNLKLDAPKLAADSKQTGEILNQTKNRHVWLAASTHPGEEAMIAQVHKMLKEQFDDTLTIIVPRHADRGNEVAAQLRGLGVNVNLRSQGKDIDEVTDIYLADTMGELGIFYRIAGIVFMGGSLVPHGGQNPLEPARLDCVVICGPHMENFASLSREMEQEAALLKVRNTDHLAKTVEDLMRDHDKQEALAQTASKFVSERKGVLEQIMTTLEPYMVTIRKENEDVST